MGIRLKVAASCCLLLFAPDLPRTEARPVAEPFGLIGRVLGVVLSGDKKEKEKGKKEGQDGGVNDGYGAPSSGYGAPSSGYGAPSSGYGAPSCACRRIFNFFHGGKKEEKEKGKKEGEDGGDGCNCGGYQYQQPSSGYGAPSSSYGAPSSSYGSPCRNRRLFFLSGE